MKWFWILAAVYFLAFVVYFVDEFAGFTIFMIGMGLWAWAKGTGRLNV